VIDRLPEPPTQATARGTLVHAALERLFDLPAAERTPQAARALILPEWDRLAADEPELAALFPDEAERASWLQSAIAILDAYFTLEDPRRLEPAERESYVETTLDSGLRLRGYIDRLDVAPGGEIRIVDYKTGRAPREAYEASALFGMGAPKKTPPEIIQKLNQEINAILAEPDEDKRMPLFDKPLSGPQRELVRRWIESGAPRGVAHCSEAGCILVDGHCLRATHAEAQRSPILS